MSPEDDVTKDSDAQDSEANSTTVTDTTEGRGPKNSAQDADVASDVETSADTANEAAATGDEIDQAAAAQDAAANESNVEQAGASDDDPLGFGSARMDGEDPAEEQPPSVESQLEESEARVATLQDQLLRMQAEMENQRKRAQNDVTKAHKFALEKIALDLLPVKDSLEMGITAATADDAEPAKIVEGSELTLKMLAQALEKYNIVEVNPVDEKFDPEFHQAMSMQPVEGKEPNTVAQVLQKGYTLNERLIRPALVMVAK